LLAQPIPAWCEGRGTGGVSYFELKDERLRFLPAIAAALIPSAQDLIREVVDWRLAEYFSRNEINATEDYSLKVSRSGPQPMLFLPDRNTHTELPDGWTVVKANGQEFKANFVKVALNVVHGPDSEDNVLPRLLIDWFGPDAGRPGTKHHVTLRREGADWVLTPAGVSTGTAVPYKTYLRPEIPPLFALKHSEFWRQGFIRQGNLTFLLVTLDKSGHEEAFKYKDHFLSPTEFQWQSQNQTSQKSRAGESLRDHRQLHIDVHLFVRAKAKSAEGRGAPFYYLGQIYFQSWEGDRPITVKWSLKSPVPRQLWRELAVPGDGN
jgi:hypothetical protein